MPDLRQGCAKGKSTEETMPADALVLFGAMGDLAHKKIFPALYHMVRHGHLDVPVIGILLIARTHPQLVSRDCADFGNQQRWTHLIAKLLDRQDRFYCMLAWHEVFGLKSLARARSETHAKVRQAFVPRTGNSHLLGTILSRQCSDRVHIAGGELRPVKLWSSVKYLPFFHAALDPQFVDALLLPVRKQAHAAAAGFDGVEVLPDRLAFPMEDQGEDAARPFAA
jgi:glucose-6-phosphate dehydrogenase-like protein